MTASELKKQIKQLAAKHGPDVIKRQLVIEGLGFSTSEKLANGSYHSEPGHRVMRAAKAVLNKYKEAKAS